MVKKCVRCLVDKPATLEYFYSNYLSKDGFKNVCKDCKNKSRPVYKYDSFDENVFQICTKCKEQKPATPAFFHKDSHRKIGLRTTCSICDKTPAKKAPPIGKQETLRRNRDRRKTIEYKQKEKVWISANIERVREIKKNYKLRHPDRIKLYRKTYIKKEPSPEKKKQYSINTYKRRMADPIKKMTSYIKSAMSASIKKGVKMRSFNIINYTIPELRSHLESLWVDGMSWENYGKRGWHIDHIKPIASFDMSNPDEIKKCWALSNLQPLWGKDNYSKGSFYNGKRHWVNGSKFAKAI